ncbi:MAG: YihA family ribosome biogenesis GTP-binding protein [Clostridia bacterium]|nr:YihA family ribosome biogenesis GTP-binding protein [Clostridia bacterium]
MALQIQKADLAISAGTVTQFPIDRLPQIVFSGRSNVGKSSLINALLGRKSLARVSGEPGKTITINFYKIDGSLYFVDLPGYGFAKRAAKDQAVWSSLTDRFFTQNHQLDRLALVLQLIDMKVGPTQDDRLMLDFLIRTGLPFAVVATKSDKLNSTGRAASLKGLGEDPSIPAGTPIIPFSALKREGIEEVWKLIFEKTGLG